MSRFNYVRYDAESQALQEEFKSSVEGLEKLAMEKLPEGRARALFLTSLEEAYMWTGKAIRDAQVARGGQPEHIAERSNE